ncbi:MULTISPECIES: type 1 glutamine amidotransferase domain-containing protein [unclassified Pantoea]|uniref:type 1 glutamine amidotransferase domain-containing protein n=1 Tax=unclassified Pantoea TaxID=2630326 RepID=UPI001CD53DF4|nr:MULTISPECIES: type 1 glutamine amidotransferase domain-containing protein [unclassified Pantoea]MCA1179419.1 type 1 glutamine amidotransferase domain-containing protein [Pantoea sp. alder69]MCA1253030.1 type 1 glutamine amidotransferase domain-containing protein [Pantoea sp. alder70]MCA1268204.1 type 1 glutamine amidotransferase domain-containing protein [Pantoea sp. alder81]
MNGVQPHSVKPVLLVLSSFRDIVAGHEISGFYLPELIHPFHVLESAGIRTVFASVKGGKPPVYGIQDDAINQHYWQDTGFQQRLNNTLPLAATKSEDYSAILFVGGHGTMWDFPDDAALKYLTRQMYESGKPVAAVCHGPAALINVKLRNGQYLLKGKHVAAFTDTEEMEVGMANVVPFMLEAALKERGARHQPADNWQCNVVTDGLLITGQNPQSASAVGEALCHALLGKNSIAL